MNVLATVLPLFCQYFSVEKGEIYLNELILSTFIQIMQSGFVRNDKQEAAGRFLLESVSLQEDANCTTDLNSKKISRLVSRKDPVPDDIKQASLDSKVADKVYEYFKKEVLADLNPNLKYDIFEKLCKVIEQDVQVARKKKEEFKGLFDNAEYDKFLADIFLYTLSRDNKKVSDKVEPQDVPFLTEVNYECPITHEKLVEYVKDVPMRRYVITQIFPDDLTEDELKEFEKVVPRPQDYDSVSNLIALGEKASEEYLLNPTVEEFKKLRSIKKFVSSRYEAQKSIDRMELEEDIRIALAALMEIKNPSQMIGLDYKALRIDEKIKNEPLLKNEVQNHVLQYYRTIEGAFNDSEADFDTIATEIKLSSLKLEKAGLSKEEVIESLAEWIRKKANLGDRSRTACRIVVAFFIQNCEVFSREISK